MRVGVIGLGNMGRHHARIWRDMHREIPEVSLVAASDLDVTTDTERCYYDYHELLAYEGLDAVSIATPTATHAGIAMDCLRAGVHVLVEKPMALTYQEGADMLECARLNNRILSVGHVERFNPAFKALLRRLEWAGRIHYLSSSRAGLMPEHVPVEGLIGDLAPHDLDLMMQLAAGEPVSIAVETSGWGLYGFDSNAVGLFRFNTGTLASLHLSYDSPTKHRWLKAWGAAGRFEVDLIAQTLSFYHDGQVEDVPVARDEPLRSELEVFADAVIGGHPAPVSGREAQLVLAYTLAMADSAAEGRVIVEEELENRRLGLPEPGKRPEPPETA